MQQHTGQHLLSAVFEELFGLKTVSFHLGAESATIDLEGGAVEPAHARRSRAARQRDRRREPAGRRALRGCGGSAGAAQTVGPRRARCALSPSIRSTAAPAAGRTCVPPERSARSSCASSRRSARAPASNFCAAAVRSHGRAPISRRCRRPRSNSPRRSTKCPPRWPRNSRRHAPAKRSAASSKLDLAGYQGKELYDATAPGADGIRRVTRRLDRGSLDELRARRAELHRAAARRSSSRRWRSRHPSCWLYRPTPESMRARC